jgi:cytochrome c oxidase cbb3-type subunit III
MMALKPLVLGCTNPDAWLSERNYPYCRRSTFCKVMCDLTRTKLPPLISMALSAALLASTCLAQDQTQKPAAQSESQATVDAGHALFLQNCAFCHGRDASGGETGPDLTGSKLVAQDVRGDKIGAVIRNGRPEKGMPRFNLSDQDILALVAFIHHRRDYAETHPGARRRVDVSDLQTGNVEAGKQYFNGAGKCSSCHSPAGDLAGVAKRYQGLKLEQRMLYPEKARAKVTVTLPSGRTIAGTLEYKDEFTIGLRDADGWYHSWPADVVKCSVDAPADAHARLLSQYTDADIHNLMAYLQTLR